MKYILLITSLFLLSACSSIIEKQTQSLADGLSQAILDNQDVTTVEQGAPAFLLMLDGLILNSPESEGLLRAGAELNGAYASVFVNAPERKKLMQNKALDYARSALCLHNKPLCQFEDIKLQTVESELAEFDEEGVAALYTFSTTWVGWIQENSSDWLAISHIPKIKAMLTTIARIQPDYRDGGAYLYLGGLSTLIPAAMGGKPEEGKAYFEQALSISKGNNLMVKVLLAEKYARLVFDQALHDRLLNEVLAEDNQAGGYGLMNEIAKQKAQVLLDDSADYF